MILVFLGAPGSGKGTQAKILSEKLNLSHYSTGDILRLEIQSNTELSIELNRIMSKGELVSDELVNSIVKSKLSKLTEKSGCILDGYPRTYDQANYLDSYLQDNVVAIYFKIASDVLKQRITERYSCAKCGAIYNNIFSPTKISNICDNCQSTDFIKRKDDNEDSLLARIDAFEQNKDNILQYYNSLGNYIEVDASLPVEEVSREILLSIKKH